MDHTPLTRRQQLEYMLVEYYPHFTERHYVAMGLDEFYHPSASALDIIRGFVYRLHPMISMCGIK
jgi:hypothetical protein